MAIQDSTPPVACKLTPAGLATQSDRWLELGAQALLERVETAHGLRISFRREAGVEEELRALVDVERDCCAWARWTVETGTGELVLDVRASGTGIATLHGMFTKL